MRFRNRLILVFVAVVLPLSSCIDRALFEDVQEELYRGKFMFSLQGNWEENSAMTRGMSGSADGLFNHMDFAVFTTMTNSALYDSAAHHFNWMYNARICKSSGVWSYDENSTTDKSTYYMEYWKNDGMHSFFAIAPYSILQDANSHFLPASIGDAKTPEFTYSNPSAEPVATNTITKGVDIMYASKLNVEGKDYTGTNGNDWGSVNGASTSGTVPLNFEHALAQVSFEVKLEDDRALESDDVIKVQSISFDNVLYAGNVGFKEDGNLFWKQDVAKGTVQWHEGDIETMGDEFIGGANWSTDPLNMPTLNPLPYEKDGVSHIGLMMPQTFPDGATLTLNYYRTDNPSAASDPANLETVTKELKTAIAEFLPGKHYKIILRIDLSGVLRLEINSFDWNKEEVDGGVPYVYFNFLDDKRYYNVDYSKYDAAQGTNPATGYENGYKYTKVDIPYETNLRESDLRDSAILLNFEGGAVGRGIWYNGMIDSDGNEVDFDLSKHACKIDVVNNIFTYYAPTYDMAHQDPTKDADIMHVKVGNTKLDITFAYGLIRPVGKVFGDAEDIPGFKYDRELGGTDYMVMSHERMVQYIPVRSTFTETELTELWSIYNDGGSASFVSAAEYATSTSGDTYYDDYPAGDIYLKYERPTSASFDGNVDIIKMNVNGEVHDVTITWGYVETNFVIAELKDATNKYDYNLVWPLTTKMKQIIIEKAMEKGLNYAQAEAYYKSTIYYKDLVGNGVESDFGWSGNSVEFNFPTNLDISEISVSQSNLQAGKVEVEIKEVGGVRTGAAKYTRVSLEEGFDKITIKAGFETYTIDVYFPYVKLLGNKRSWTIEKTNYIQTLIFEYGGYTTTDAVTNKHNDFVTLIENEISNVMGDNLFEGDGYFNPTTKFKVSRSAEFVASSYETESRIADGDTPDTFKFYYFGSNLSGLESQKIGDNVTLRLGQLGITLPFVLIPWRN